MQTAECSAHENLSLDVLLLRNRWKVWLGGGEELEEVHSCICSTHALMSCNVYSGTGGYCGKSGGEEPEELCLQSVLHNMRYCHVTYILE